MTKRENIQKESLDTALQYKRCGLAISMGVGKTLIGLKYIDHLQGQGVETLRVLVVAPKLSIFDSWKADAEKFNINIDNLEFTTYISLNKKNPNDYDVLILDECHSLKSNYLSFLTAYDGRILGLTGTPPRFKNSEKGQMIDAFCPIVYKYITDDAVEDKILNDYRIVVHMLSLDDRLNLKMTNRAGKTWMTSELKSYSYWCSRCDGASSPKEKQITAIMRMKALQEYKSKEVYAKRLFDGIDEKCLLFCNTQEQADKLSEFSYHSDNPDSEGNLDLFGNDHITKLSCVLQLSEGINVPNLKAGIIMHAYGNERKSSQRIGRLLRLNPDDVATAHILCYKNTIDEKWVRDALKDFDETKIKYVMADYKTLNV